MSPMRLQAPIENLLYEKINFNKRPIRCHEVYDVQITYKTLLKIRKNPQLEIMYKCDKYECNGLN